MTNHSIAYCPSRQMRFVTMILIAIVVLYLQMLSQPSTIEAFTVIQRSSSSGTLRVQRSSSSSSSFFYMSSITAPSSSSSSSSNNNDNNNIESPSQIRPDDNIKVRSTTAAATSSNIIVVDTNNKNQYMTNMVQSRRGRDWIELPASSSLLQQIQKMKLEQLSNVEQIIGRIAMIGAIGIMIRECSDGLTIVEQVMHLV